MPVRSVVLFNLGPPFGGFRFAVRPGALGLDHPDAFAAIEAALSTIFEHLAHAPFERWAQLAQELISKDLVPHIGEHTGLIDFSVTQDADGTRHLVARGFFCFRYWPLGGWVVHDGRHFRPDGDVAPFTADELAPIW
jgi:hypothetical protein